MRDLRPDELGHVYGGTTAATKNKGTDRNTDKKVSNKKTDKKRST